MIGALWLSLAVTAANVPESTHFETEVIPVLTKAGCNTGACHGAAAGRGGFHLSLFGADPDADYETIVHALEGRRINLARPEFSLLIRKPTGQLEHGGGTPLDVDGPGINRLLSWIRSGAPRGNTRQLTRFEVHPQRIVCASTPAEVKLQAQASFENGEPIDVIDWTVLTPADPSSVTIDHNHTAHIQGCGQHLVIARFLDRVVPIQILVPYSARQPDDSAFEPANFIDVEIIKTLSDLRLPASPPASDTAWLRRVTIDLIGRLPSPEEIQEFQNDQAAGRRIQVVERLLASEAFADYWAFRFGKLLRMHSLPNETGGLQAYSQWLRHELEVGTGWDVLASQLIMSTGDAHHIGPANFHRMVGDPRAEAELVGTFLAGVQLGCANCHNHPLDRWTQDDYHGLAAVFARVDRGRQVRLQERGEVTNLRTGEPAIPRIPGQEYLEAGGDHRQQVLDWVLDQEHLYFATATTNRLWRAMFGRGLIEPPDDLRVTNPATHPQLLRQLAEDFASHGYQIRHTLKLIALSQTYARSSQALSANAGDDRFYTRAYWRPLEPEVFLDAVVDVTGAPENFGEVSVDRAVAIVDSAASIPALDAIGRCRRANGCAEEAAPAPVLSAQLHLMNGPLLNEKILRPTGRLSQLLAAGKTDAEVISEFYLRAFGRPPDAGELDDWGTRLKSEDVDDRRRRLEDFLWALLNSREFRENH